MQIDPEAKMIYVHIPRTGGSWFSYQWPAHHTRAPFLKKTNLEGIVGFQVYSKGLKKLIIIMLIIK